MLHVAELEADHPRPVRRPARVSCPGRQGSGYPPEVVAAARALVEAGLGTRRVAARVGIDRSTVRDWARRHGWARPPRAPRRPRRRRLAEPPSFAGRPSRARWLKGQPYRTETVAAVRALVLGSRLTHREIAARTGIAAQTVGLWARSRGWRRPEDAPRHNRAAAFARATPGRREAALFGRAEALALRAWAEIGAGGDAAALARAASLAAAARTGRRRNAAASPPLALGAPHRTLLRPCEPEAKQPRGLARPPGLLRCARNDGEVAFAMMERLRSR